MGLFLKRIAWNSLYMKPIFFNSLPARHHCHFLILVTVTAWAETAQAKEIYIQPSISLQAEYDDNKRMSTDRFSAVDTSAYGVITRAGAKVGMRSSQYDLEVNNQLIINRYKSDFDLDSEDFNLDLTAGYNFSAKSRLGLSADFTRDTTLTSELEGDNGTGLVQDNIIRQQWSITPNWSYSLSNTQFLQTSYTHSETTYEESELGSFVDYSIDNISLSFRQQWTAVFSNNISVTAMSFDIPEIINGFVKSSRETTEYSVNIGADYEIAPTWSTSITVGQRFTNTEERQNFNFNTGRFEEVTTSSDVQGLIFSLNLTKQFETASADVTYSRSTSAQGDGRLQVSDSLSANYRHSLTQSLLFSINANINERTNSGEEDDGNGRTYYSIRPSVRWRLDRKASLTAAYRYRNQSFDSNGEEAVSNAISLNFNYQWDKVATQRY